MKQAPFNTHYQHKDILIIPDTSALLRGFQLLISIFNREKIQWKLPHTVITELDRIKDNKNHKENRNAHKILSSLKNMQYEMAKESYKHNNNDDSIIATATNATKDNAYKVFIISEDKTFKLKFQNTLSLNEFRERFENLNDNIPNHITEQLFASIARKDSITSIQLLYNEDIKINAYNAKGFTPLICAIKNKDYELIQAILQHKKRDIHKTDMSHLKMTPLAHAVQGDDIKSVDMLLSHNAKPYIGNKGLNRSNTPFLMACWDNRKNALKILEKLLQYKISINQVDNNGYSGLIKASIKGHKAIAQWLLDNNADKNLRDFKENKNALEFAIANNHTEIIKILKD